MMSMSLCYDDLRYSVSCRAGDKKQLLTSGVNGNAKSGRAFAVLGPSGAGKTTLLSVLYGDASTHSNGTVSGSIELNGAACDAAAMRQMSCIVRQVDVLLATATVQETLLFHALLQLPRGMPAQAKKARVEQVLQLLGLTSSANTMVGDSLAGIKGISGGERRRLALGVELINEPSIIFLDEPTSGLDSETALQVMQYVVSLAHDHGRLVMFNIHQPNTDIAELFDDLCLLAPGGRAVFSGSSSTALDMFAGLGHVLPPLKAPCDFYMALLADADTSAKLADAWAEAAQHSSCAWDGLKDVGTPAFQLVASSVCARDQDHESFHIRLCIRPFSS